MELERLVTLMDHGLKRHQDVMLLVQNGLTDRIAGSAGNVCKGLIAAKEYEWESNITHTLTLHLDPRSTSVIGVLKSSGIYEYPSRNDLERSIYLYLDSPKDFNFSEVQWDRLRHRCPGTGTLSSERPDATATAATSAISPGL